MFTSRRGRSLISELSSCMVAEEAFERSSEVLEVMPWCKKYFCSSLSGANLFQSSSIAYEQVLSAPCSYVVEPAVYK